MVPYPIRRHEMGYISILPKSSGLKVAEESNSEKYSSTSRGERVTGP